MNTPSMTVSPSIILLQPHVGRFHASDQEKSRFSADVQAMFGHQVVICHHVYATIVVVWFRFANVMVNIICYFVYY